MEEPQPSAHAGYVDNHFYLIMLIKMIYTVWATFAGLI